MDEEEGSRVKRKEKNEEGLSEKRGGRVEGRHGGGRMIPYISLVNVALSNDRTERFPNGNRIIDNE